MKALKKPFAVKFANTKAVELADDTELFLGEIDNLPIFIGVNALAWDVDYQKINSFPIYTFGECDPFYLGLVEVYGVKHSHSVTFDEVALQKAGLTKGAVMPLVQDYINNKLIRYFKGDYNRATSPNAFGLSAGCLVKVQVANGEMPCKLLTPAKIVDYGTASTAYRNYWKATGILPTGQEVELEWLHSNQDPQAWDWNNNSHHSVITA